MLRQARIHFFIFILVTTAFHSPLLAQEVYLGELKFEGNQDISSSRLKSAIKTQESPWYHTFMFWKDAPLFDEEVFLNDLLRLEKYYHQQGYLNAIIKDYELRREKEDRVDVLVEIEEGKPTVVDRIEFLPGDGISLPFPRERLAKWSKLKPGKPYREDDLRADYNRYIQRFSNLGYPYVRAQVKPVIDREAHTVVLEWYIDPGPFCTFGEIAVDGNNSVADEVILRGLDFKPGDRFEQKHLASSQSQIYRLQLFQYVSLQAQNLDQRPARIPIQIALKERSIRTLKFGVGYGTEEFFRFTGDWTHRNFFGGARILNAEIKHSTRLLPLNIELSFSQPYFLDNQNDLIIKPFFIWQDEKSFEVRRIGFESTFNRRLDDITNTFVTVRLERDSVRTKGGDISDRLADLYNKSVLQTGIRWNATDQLFTPTKGYIARIILEEAGLLLSSRFRYYKISGEYRSFHQLAPDYIFAWRAKAGGMDAYRGSTTTPVEERFFAGGSYSVRGWGRQLLGPQLVDADSGEPVPRGGNSLFEGSFELRFPILAEFRGAAFLDFGNVWPEWSDIDPLDLKFAAGLGLRYLTPIGPFRIDFARKLNKQIPEESDFQVHISIGQAF